MSTSRVTRAVLQNVGTKLKYLQAGDDLPRTFRVGVGYQNSPAAGHGLQINADVLFPTDGDPTPQAGLEYSWQNQFFGRIGYQVRSESGVLTAGGGVRMYELQLDYAFTSSAFGETAHRIGVSYAFAGSKP